MHPNICLVISPGNLKQTFPWPQSKCCLSFSVGLLRRPAFWTIMPTTLLVVFINSKLISADLYYSISSHNLACISINLLISNTIDFKNANLSTGQLILPATVTFWLKSFSLSISIIVFFGLLLSSQTPNDAEVCLCRVVFMSQISNLSAANSAACTFRYSRL